MPTIVTMSAGRDRERLGEELATAAMSTRTVGQRQRGPYPSLVPARESYHGHARLAPRPHGALVLARSATVAATDHPGEPPRAGGQRHGVGGPHSASVPVRTALIAHQMTHDVKTGILRTTRTMRLPHQTSAVEVYGKRQQTSRQPSRESPPLRRGGGRPRLRQRKTRERLGVRLLHSTPASTTVTSPSENALVGRTETPA